MKKSAPLNLLLVGTVAELPGSIRSAFAPEMDLSFTYAPTFRVALAIVKSQSFDCAVVDTSLGGGDGIALAPVIKRFNPQCIQILLTQNNRWASVEAAHALGFNLVLDKQSSLAATATSIEQKLTTATPDESSFLIGLTLRESEILRDLATGMRNIEIAQLRHLSESTIKTHLASIYRKLGVRNRVEAIAVMNNY
jgi:DNA-binding NarL/FixJ family response regulator